MPGKLTQKKKSYQDFLCGRKRVKVGEDKGFICLLGVAQSDDRHETGEGDSNNKVLPAAWYPDTSALWLLRQDSIKDFLWLLV